MSELPPEHPLEYYYYLYKVAAFYNLTTGIVYGAYIVAYITSVYVLLCKPGFTSNPTRMFMFGITTFMFALGIIALVLVTIVEFRLVMRFIIGLPMSPLILNCYYVWETITCLMYILCDVICASRTVVLWNRDKRVIAVLVLSVLGTIAAAAYAFATGIIFCLIPDETNPMMGRLDLILICPTLATNLLSTGLIAWKAWQRRITVGKHLREGSRFLRIDRVFALLIESGLIYCLIWIIYCISTFGVIPSPSFTLIVFVSGLYPTLIIILISKQMSPVDHYSTHSNEMHFTGVSALEPPRDHGGVPRDQLTICPDAISNPEIQFPSTASMKSSDEERSPV